MSQKSSEETRIAVVDLVEPLILTIRGQKVLVDSDLAALYGTATKVLNQAVKRNTDRFPTDFMFRLTDAEKKEVVTNCDHLARLRFSPSRPQVFTEHGAIMAASVLNTPRAVQTSVYVVRAFVNLRRLVLTHQDLIAKLAEIERRLGGHDETIRQLVTAFRQLMAPAPVSKRRPIGFHADTVEEGPTGKAKARRG